MHPHFRLIGITFRHSAVEGLVEGARGVVARTQEIVETQSQRTKKSSKEDNLRIKLMACAGQTSSHGDGGEDGDWMELDSVAVEILKAANVDAEVLQTLTREDLKDLFPGPEHFRRRKAIWDLAHPVEQTTEQSDGPVQPAVKKSPMKIVQLPSPQYVIYTDSELEHVRREYFEFKRIGRERECRLSKELYCRLIRNTIISMITAVRASGGTDCLQYPTKEGLQAMARRLMDYYPMVADWADTSCPWSNIFKKLSKRLQNIKSPRKWQGATPSRGNGKRRRLSFENTPDMELADEQEEPVMDLSPCASVSPRSTICTPERPQGHSPNTASENLVKSGPKLHDSRIAQARHYKTLQEMFQKPKQDKEAVAQLLNLEFEARRNFIDADLLKEPDKAAKTIDAYPCFKDIDHALDEVGRIISKGQHNYVKELRERWEVFKQKLIFYAVYKKAMKPPMSLSEEEQAIELLKCLPVLFPSNAALPKKLSNASDALFHILLPSQEPGMFLQKRPLCTPVLLIDEDGGFICAGSTPISPFPKSKLKEAILYIMAYYYVFHMAYPKCIASLLLALQTEVLQDPITNNDATPAYKKAMAEFAAFVG